VDAATGQNMSFQMPRAVRDCRTSVTGSTGRESVERLDLMGFLPDPSKGAARRHSLPCASRASSLKAQFLRSIRFFPWTLRSSAAGAIFFFSNQSLSGRVLR
jgi:hypothetical protein